MRALLLTALFLIAGCPADPAVADRPSGAAPCTTDEDCNPAGKTCGLLRACVDQRCEAAPSRTVHCP